MTPPTLDIVIVSFNAREDLRACLESLSRHPPSVAASVIVVDNASSDGSGDLVATSFPGVRLIALSSNVGFAAGNNVGIRAGHHDLVLLLNSDTIVPATAIDGMVAALLARPEAAALGPRLIDDDGRAELSCGRMLSPWNELRQKLLGAAYHRRLPLVTAYVDRLTKTSRTVDWVSGACLLVRRADAERVGLLDERYFMYAEDVDFCAALRARGRAVIFDPVVEVRHRRGRSRRSAADATARAYRRSQLAFYAKHHPTWYRVLAWYLRIRRALPPDA